jgi:molybdate transport system regulatory protein
VTDLTEDIELLENLTPRFKLWLELDGVTILGKGGALLLRSIEEHGSISQALRSLSAEDLGAADPPSYRFAWGYLQKVEERLGASIVEKRRGHRSGTGGTALTPLGRTLLNRYEEIEKQLETTLRKNK